MRKFKKGDLVRCTGTNIFGEESCIEYEGIITGDEDQCHLGVDREWTMHRDNLELIKAAKPTRKELKKKIKKKIKKLEAELIELKSLKEETPQLQEGDHVKLIDDGIHLKKGTVSTVKKVIHSGAVQLETICCEPLSKLERQ